MKIINTMKRNASKFANAFGNETEMLVDESSKMVKKMRK